MRQVREVWQRTLSILASTFAWVYPAFSAQDLHLLFWVGVLAIGLEQVYHPLIWIAPGAAFTWLAWPKRQSIPVKPRKDS